MATKEGILADVVLPSHSVEMGMVAADPECLVLPPTFNTNSASLLHIAAPTLKTVNPVEELSLMAQTNAILQHVNEAMVTKTESSIAGDEKLTAVMSADGHSIIIIQNQGAVFNINTFELNAGADKGKNVQTLVQSGPNSFVLIQPQATSQDLPTASRVSGITTSEQMRDEPKPFQPDRKEDTINKTDLPVSINVSGHVGTIPTNSNEVTGSSVMLQVITNDSEERSSPDENSAITLISEINTSENDKDIAIANDVGLDKKEEKPHIKCDLCSATFTRLGNLTRHHMIHTINRMDNYRYKCNICDRLFLQRCDRERHLLIHTGKEPHRCKKCGKGYVRRSDLVVHMRFHNKERNFVCATCGKSYFQNGDLRRHIRLVHEKRENMLTCGHCKMRYSRDATLIRHMQVAHKDIILKSLQQLPGEESSNPSVLAAVTIQMAQPNITQQNADKDTTGILTQLAVVAQECGTIPSVDNGQDIQTSVRPVSRPPGVSQGNSILTTVTPSLDLREPCLSLPD